MVPISRRKLLAAAPFLLLGPARARTASVHLGAIRWDAWYKKTDSSVHPQNNLSSAKYRWRAPIHCVEEKRENLSCTGAQQVIDDEIRAAAKGGISFWAFDWFPKGSSLRIAWELYQSSSLKHLIQWCPIVGLQELGSVQSSSSEIDRKLQDWIELMRSPTFFSVQEDGSKRPLLFLFYRPEEMTKYFKTLDSLRSCLERFRKLAVRAGVGKPYIVLFNPAVDMTLFRDSGADAISNYISQLEPRKAASYIDLDRQVQRYWKRMAASGAPMIPIAQVGWDTRPRKDNPVPWEKKTGDKENYYKIATPEEFYNHIRAARQFVENNSDKCVSRVVLIYSWDECDEGGCIMPTIGDPTGKYLAALKRAMD
jgi:hypothetical protein